MMDLAAPPAYASRMAVEYAVRHGFKVLPLHTVREGRCSCSRGPTCSRPGKHPRIRRWQQVASREAATIASWWDEWPDGNVGLLTGAENGIAVLDVDPRHGGDETLRGLERRYGHLPETVRALTGGGGQHVVFRHPGRQIRNTRDALGAGIDVRADSGLIVAPPSMHQSGREYLWHPEYALGAVEIAPMPDWLVEHLAGARRVREAPASTARPRRRFRWATVLDGVPAGRRHTDIFLMSCALRGHGTPEAVAETLALYAAGRCRPPFPPAEALAIVGDVYSRYAPNGQRSTGMSPERIDVLDVLSTTPRPRQPAEVAEMLGKGRGAVKKLLAAMYADGQVDRVPGGYVRRIAAAVNGVSPFPVAEPGAGDDWGEV